LLRNRALPPETQDAVARFLLQFAGGDEPVIQLTAEEEADLAAADDEIARSEFATRRRDAGDLGEASKSVKPSYTKRAARSTKLLITSPLDRHRGQRTCATTYKPS